MTEVNVSVTVEMSATVGEFLQQWGKFPQQLGNLIIYGQGNLRVEIVIHNSA